MCLSDRRMESWELCRSLDGVIHMIIIDCVRHFAANFATKFKKAGMSDRLVELVSEVQPKKFELLWEELLTP